MSGAMSGGCACGRIRFEAEVEGDEAYLGHCRMVHSRPLISG